MKYGFTLIEMLIILIFISIITLMTVPNITNMLKKGEEDKYTVFLNSVYLATEAYIEKNKDDYPTLNIEGAKTYIYMKDLVDDKFVSTNLVNPKYCVDGECTSRTVAQCNDVVCVVDDYTIVVTKDEDGKYKYEFVNGIADEVCDYEVNDVVFDESYSGIEKTFTPLCAGKYKLEVWGAQGYSYNSSYIGGKGGYSTGVIDLQFEKLSIVIGGKGTQDINSGYNGGGYGTTVGSTWIGGSGGGATHIAYHNVNHSTLKSYETASVAIDYVLIVAGGGGSAAHETTQNHYGIGGAGGGTTGGNGTTTNSIWPAGTGGTQTQAGTNTNLSYSASFGEGANGNPSGGGGGWYGGGHGYVSGGAGGGSGYISSLLTNASMESGVQSGDGRAKITYLGE